MATESPNSVQKIVVHLRATGGAPILKQSKFKISGTDKFAKVIDFLRRQLHSDSLVTIHQHLLCYLLKVIDLCTDISPLCKFVYVNSAFSPNPDESVIDLYNNFGFDGKLVVNYASSMAWG